MIIRMMASNQPVGSQSDRVDPCCVGHVCEWWPLLSCSGLTGSRWRCHNVRHCSCFTVAFPSFSLISLKSERWAIHLLLGNVSPFTFPLFHSLTHTLSLLCSFSPRGQIRGLKELYAHVRTWDCLFTLVFHVFLSLLKICFFPSCPHTYTDSIQFNSILFI